MRLRNIPWAREAVAGNPLVFDESEAVLHRWDEIFGRSAPKAVEIGMGKGKFIIEMATRHPEMDFIGIERYESVMIRALQRIDTLRDAGHTFNNLRFICMDATYIGDYFEPHSLDRIYLNFSDPWPKKRHAKRRLVSREFLERFKGLLISGGRIEFKTDNEDLFRFGLEEIDPAGYKLEYLSWDLHSDENAMRDNCMTEYEERFSGIGNKIKKYTIKPMM